jgi:predicted component of type VI protein secretion system
MRSLTVVGGLLEGKDIPLKVAQFKIGRGPSCHLRPVSEDVGQLHAMIITYNDGKTYIADTGTSKGVIVNDRILIGGQLQLEDGDTIVIGPLSFRFNATREAKPQMPVKNYDTVAMTPSVRPASSSIPPALPHAYHRQDSALSEQPPAFLTESNIFVVSRKDDALDLETLPDFDLDRNEPLINEKAAPKKSVNQK